MVIWLFGLVMACSSFAVPAAWAQQAPSQPTEATGRQWMVATVHPLATEAGLRAFDRGGNAVDAAIAAALTLGVVDGFNSGIGGGCFILIRAADGRMVAIDGRECAPLAAHRDMYLRDGVPDTRLSQHGPLAVARPGALAAYAEAVQELGKCDLKSLLLDAADTAAQGFVISPLYARLIFSEQREFKRWEACRQIFLHADGSPKLAGETLVQADLANTYRQIADHGCDWFYQGPFAEATAQWMAAHGGLLTQDDFAQYRTVRRKPLMTTYRDFQIVGFPPPSSGGVHVAQILNVLEHFDLAAMYRHSPVDAAHVMVESMKLAFADRAFWLGDPAFTDVPRGLIDRSYAASLAARIDPQRAIEVSQPGNPLEFDSRYFDKHTTHIAAADAEGNWVAITTTVNTSFGSKVIIPGTGVVLNNQMDDFAIAPGIPNAFGLVGSDANCVEPGKRPLSSMSPTIVLRDDQPVMTIGAAGGPRIITQVLLGLVRHLDFGLPLNQSLSDARFHQQWSPPQVFVERGMNPSIVNGLRDRGHQVEWTATAGITQAIVWRDGQFIGVADPRAGGQAAGR